MSLNTSSRRSTPQPYGWPFLCIFAIALAYTLDLTRRLTHFNLIFWDAKVYARAIHAFLTGGDPYTRSPDLNFIYSPLFLRGGALLSHVFPAQAAWPLYLLLNAAAVFLIPVLLARFYLQARWLTPAVAMAIFFFHPLLTAQTAFTSGNICSILYALVLAAGIPGLRRNRWLWFYLAVAVASLIKPTFLAFLLLPVVLRAGQVLISLLTTAAVFLAFALERFFMPALYRAFLDSVYHQVVTLSDTGFGLLSRLLPLAVHLPGPHQTVAGLLATALLASLVAGLWLLRRTSQHAAPESIWIAAILVIVILTNLRLLAYDADIAILPAAFILVESLRRLFARNTAPLAIVVPIMASTVLLAKDPRSFFLLFLLSSVLLVLGRIPLRQPTHQSRPQEAAPSTRIAA